MAVTCFINLEVWTLDNLEHTVSYTSIGPKELVPLYSV
jgi:hypothetical protein